MHLANFRGGDHLLLDVNMAALAAAHWSRGSGHDVVGAIVGRTRDLHDLEVVGILDVLLRDLALVDDAVALARHHLAKPLELAAEPAAHHEDQMKTGVVGVARGAAARLELLDGTAA